MLLRLCPLAVLPLLAACATTFLPSYDAALFREIDAANQEIAKIDAATDAAIAPPPSFEKLEPYYTGALPHLGRAQQIAEARYAGVRRRPSANAAGIVAQSVGVCQEAVRTLLQFNKTRPLSRATFRESLVSENCSIPQAMASRLPKGR